MNDITEFLKNRRSVLIKNLNAEPVDKGDIDEILECGLRVPDHGVLGPWRISVITSETGRHLGQHILAPEFAAQHAEATEAMLTFERHRFTRTGLVLAVISTPIEHIKIPAWEMHLSAGALCMNLLHGSAPKVERVLRGCLDRGVELKWFGATEPQGFTSRYDSWRYASKQSLPQSDRILGAILDMRLPLTFSVADCELIARIIRDVVSQVYQSSE